MFTETPSGTGVCPALTQLTLVNTSGRVQFSSPDYLLSHSVCDDKDSYHVKSVYFDPAG